MSNDRKDRAARAEQMRKEREKADKRQRNLITVAIVVIVIGLIAAAGWAVKTTSDQNAAETKAVTPPGSTKDYGVVYTPEDAGASAEALEENPEPVKVVLYEDLQCPVCRDFEAAYAADFEELVKSGEISIEYRLLNFLERNSANEYSTRAGSAALCAYTEGDPQKFVDTLTDLYANQPAEGPGVAGPSNQELLTRLNDNGVEGADSCVLGTKYGKWLDKATEQMQSQGVSGTPSVFVDGKQVEGEGGGVPQLDAIKAAIEKAKQA